MEKLESQIKIIQTNYIMVENYAGQFDQSW